MEPRTIKNAEEFENALRGTGKKAVLFYSQWCPFCLSFMPDFENAAAGAPENFLRVCVDEAPDLEDRFAVEVVPTVLFFSGGKLEKRLNGELGAGLSGERLLKFLQACGLPGEAR